MYSVFFSTPTKEAQVKIDRLKSSYILILLCSAFMFNQIQNLLNEIKEHLKPQLMQRSKSIQTFFVNKTTWLFNGLSIWAELTEAVIIADFSQTSPSMEIPLSIKSAISWPSSLKYTPNYQLANYIRCITTVKSIISKCFIYRRVRASEDEDCKDHNIINIHDRSSTMLSI